MKKILRRIKEQYGKWLRKRRCRAIEKFRRTMKEAYPDGAEFLGQLSSVPEVADAFILKGSFAAEGFVSAMGLTDSYREWEKRQYTEIKKKYPDLKVLVFHYTPDNEGIDH